MAPLHGQVALITGGARGIGAAIARRLASDGASIAIGYLASTDKARSLVRDLMESGVRAVALRADQSDPREVTQLIDHGMELFGRLDILVNNAGVLVTGEAGDPSFDRHAVERQFAINVGGVAAAVRAAVPRMSEGGRIVTIGSTLALHAPFPGLADYSASKAAVAAYTRGWARELGPRRITVNLVQPGPIDTDMNPADGAFAPAMKASTVLGRYGRPEEVAAAVAYLASAEAAFVTGATIDVDGGFAL